MNNFMDDIREGFSKEAEKQNLEIYAWVGEEDRNIV
jgi:hypothetical protein